jgi:histidyl-tRNA synthetase
MGDSESSVGSIAGGGRYDNLVGMFDSKHKQVPCVGVSIGVERIFAVLEAKYAATNKKIRTTEIQVYVATAQKNLVEERMKLCRQLWDEGFKVSVVGSLRQPGNLFVLRWSTLTRKIRNFSHSCNTVRSIAFR